MKILVLTPFFVPKDTIISSSDRENRLFGFPTVAVGSRNSEILSRSIFPQVSIFSKVSVCSRASVV